MKYALRLKSDKTLNSLRFDTAEAAWNYVHNANQYLWEVVGLREEIVPMEQRMTWVVKGE